MPVPAAATSLDDPILAALSTRHARFARAAGHALRYPADVSPMAALRVPDARAFDDLRALAEPGETLALVARRLPAVPAGWEVLLSRAIDQMAWAGGPPPAPAEEPLRLGDADVPDMLALTALTKPGPFLARTHHMGRYYGLRAADGRLMAMTGERLTADDFTEISAVCTHPDFAGRGLARRLVTHVLGQLLAEGRFPILHVKTENDGAKRLYAQLGFRPSGAMEFVVIRRP
jgi:ribosomal protein S18 acetylase RimI-like enzyme